MANSVEQSARAPENIETREDLAHALTAARSHAGLTVRELARRLDVPSATVGDYCSGRHLPGPGQHDVFCALLRECGVAEGSLAAWVEALTRVRLSADGRVGRIPSPYRGLEAFQAHDAAWFFGRETATDDVLDALRRLRDDQAGGHGLLLVLGPSGVGKSSLLRAGVQARVHAGALDADGLAWTTAVMTPNSGPVERLRACLSGADAERTLLIVDQLEEVFAADAAERKEFLSELARLRPPDALVVAGMRADFYGAALSEPLLVDALNRGPILLGPMTEEEIRRAIVEPARQVGVPVEDGLVELLLAEMGLGTSSEWTHDAGALPLLSYALLATWERAQRNQLTVADYTAAGGLRGAISQRAEEVYSQLGPAQQNLVRRVFSRLVSVQDDAPLTRRRVARDELTALHLNACTETDGTDSAEDVLERFVAARLVTADHDTVELSHEALLTAWPRLAGWLDQDRAGLRLHHQLTDAANNWTAAGEDPSLLLRGTRLQAIAEWAAEPDHGEALNDVERRFLDASTSVAAGERRAARRRTRRMQQLTAGVAVFAIAAIVLAVVALNARHVADVARDQALSREVAIEAGDLQPGDPALAMQLALAAYRIFPTTQATSTLLDASAGEMPTRLLGPIGPTSVALGGGSVMAVGYSATDVVRLYELGPSGRPSLMATITVGPRASSTYALALSPDGRLLAAGGTSGTIELWDLGSPSHPVKLATLSGLSGTVYGLDFSADGRLLAAADSDGTVRQWTLRSASRPASLPTLVAPGHPALQAVGYSPDGLALSAVGAGGKLVVWRVRGRRSPLADVTVDATTTLTSVAYSPDGRMLVAGAQDGLVYRWSVGADGAPSVAQKPLGGFTSWVDSLAFSENGRYLAAGDSDLSLRVWSTATWRHVATFRHPAPVTGIAFTPNAQHLISVDEDGTARIWSFPPPSTYREPGNVYTIDYTRNGGELAAVSGGPHGDVGLWNVANPWRPVGIGSVTVPGSFGPVAGVEAFSPDGKLLAVGNASADVQLISLARPGHPRLLGRTLTGATPDIEQLNFSPNMKLLSVGDDSGRIHLWNIEDPADPTALPTLDPKGASSNVFGVAYSPNGTLLAAACADHRVWLWDIADPDHPRRVAVLGGFSSYVYTVAFSPNGRTLIAGSADNTVRLWDVSDPAHPRPLARLTGPTSTVYQVNVSPDGSTLAASTTGQQVWLWNISDPAHPRLEAELTAATGQVFDVAFSPNDTTMVASGADQTLTFWDYRPGQVAGRICSLAGTPITRAEWAQYIQGAAYDPPCR